jgi:hypothetical protein
MSTFQFNKNHIKIPYVTPIMTKTIVEGKNWQIWIFLYQSFYDVWMPTYNPFLNMNYINQGLYFIIINLLEVNLSSSILKKSTENFFKPLSPMSCQ